MTAKSTTSIHRKKKHLSNNQYVIQCMNWFKTALEENAAQLPKIFIDVSLVCNVVTFLCGK